MHSQQISLRDAVGFIPIYSGGHDGVSFREFAAACLDAKIMVSESSEEALTHFIRTRLRDGPLWLVRYSPPVNNITDLLRLLKGIYGPKESSLSFYGELSRFCQGPDEEVANYFFRALTICDNIIEAYKNEHNDTITIDRKLEFENTCKEAFVLGLNPEIYRLMPATTDLIKAASLAIGFEYQLLYQTSLRATEFAKLESSSVWNCGHPQKLPLLQNEETFKVIPVEIKPDYIPIYEIPEGLQPITIVSPDTSFDQNLANNNSISKSKFVDTYEVTNRNSGSDTKFVETNEFANEISALESKLADTNEIASENTIIEDRNSSLMVKANRNRQIEVLITEQNNQAKSVIRSKRYIVKPTRGQRPGRAPSLIKPRPRGH